MNHVIQIQELVKRFGDITAVDNISLDIQEGEIYGLLGPNGAGKSTTINILCGMLHKNHGDVRIFGKSIDQDMMSIKQDIGIVPQEIAIYEDLTAMENVRFFGSLYGLKGKALKEKSEQALQFVGLLDKKSQMPKSFSGGMRRRLNIACAIVHQPKLIIMDEPTVGIDPQSRNHILHSVQKLNKMGSTIIYTTHYMEEAEFLCTRIGIIDHGKVIAEGTVEELQNIVADRNTVVITTDIAEAYDYQPLREVKGVTNVIIENNQVHVECLKESNDIGEIVNYFTTRQVPIMDIQMQGVSLETTFLSLTGRKLRD